MTVKSMADIRARVEAARGVTNVPRETVASAQELRTWPDWMIETLVKLRLRENWPTILIASHLGKSHEAVRSKLSRLGIIVQERRIRRREAACR